MSLKSFKPVTPSNRYKVWPSFDEITTSTPEKSLCRPLKKSGGRNNNGRITTRHIGGGHKRKYRLVDFKRNKFDVPATVLTIEYDPNRTSRIALLTYVDGEKRYIIAPAGLKQGDKVLSGEKADIKPGNALPLGRIPVGTVVHNVEMYPGKGGQMCRAAGTYAQLVGKENKYVLLRLPSGEVRKVLATCIATIGQVGNISHENVHLGKAGRNRWLNRRPKVRGVAQNPIDHPLGGGEGRSSGGRHPVSPWGMPAKGFKTRDPNKPSGRLIVKRRSHK